jgi:polysaccharide export outer membrane protein
MNVMKYILLFSLPVLLLSACSSNRVSREATAQGQGTYYKEEALHEFFAASGPDQLPEEYLIGVGDHLDVIFPIHRDLNQVDIVVRRDGRISLPYIDDEVAAGRTPMELDSVITERYGEYLKTPELSVIVRETPQRMVYVLGQVVKPGGVKTNLDVSLLQALSEAGGMKPGAKDEHVVVIRRMGKDRVIGVEIDVKAIVQGRSLQNDFLLRDYDIVFVPKTRLQSASEVAKVLNDVIDVPFSLVTKGWQAVTLYAAYEFYTNDKNK